MVGAALPSGKKTANGYCPPAMRTSSRALLFATIAASGAACGGKTPAANCPTPPPIADNGPAVAPPPETPAAPPPIDLETIKTLAATRSYNLGTPRVVGILPDGDVLFLRTGPRSFAAELFELDSATGKVDKIASAADLVAGDVKLSAAEKALRERTRTSITGIVEVGRSEDGAKLLIPLGEQVFVFDRATRKSQTVALGAGYPDVPSLSPDGTRVAFVRDQDLWIADVAGKKPKKLTAHEGPAISYGSAEFVAQEELDRTAGYWWSPDSQKLIYQRTDETAVETLYVGNPANPSQAPTPFRYPRAGATNADVKLAIASVKGGKPVWIDWDRNALPYVRDVQWPKHGAPTLVVMNRAQTEVRVLAVDVKTGKTRQLLAESDPAWVNVPDGPHYLDDGRFLWPTEKSGDWALEIHGADGALADTITWPGFLGVYTVDDESGDVYLFGSTNALDVQIGHLAPGSKQVEPLVTAPGQHTIAVAKKGGTRVQMDMNVDGTRTQTVYRRDGSKIGELPSVSEPIPALPNVTLETVTLDGRTHNCAIVRPRNFDPNQRYPVILQVYAGPGVATVANNPRGFFKDQLLADTGFIVVRSDGRGTPGRGRDWERVITRDLITIPLADQSAALEAMGAKHPEMDLDRVGVTGWSFGGYFSAMAVILRPDLYKAAIAGAPVTDWHYYDTAYTERYMGLPAENAAAYNATSAVENAEKLTRPLMLVHGLTDDNVYVVNTLALEEALLRAGKDYDLVTLGSTHMLVDPVADAALQTREIEFFREHLGLPLAAAK
jgi:dipeptidyl-peptidase-4